MTMPHLSNCAHQGEGWCLSCVKVLEDARFQLEIELDSNKNPIYCPTCGACGIDGCCPPSKCQHGYCLYGDTYASDFEYYRKFVRAMWDRMSKNDIDALHVIHDKVWTETYSKKVNSTQLEFNL